MKPYLVLGTYIALINAAVTLLLYLTGFHSTAEKLSAAGGIAMLAMLGSTIPFMVAGVRSRRNLTPPTDDFKFGMALGIAVVIGLFATALFIAFQLIYQTLINPGYAETIIQAQISAMQAQNIPAEQIEKAEGMIRTMMKPLWQAVTGFLFWTVFDVVIALIVAAIMRRKAVAEVPPAL